MYQLSTHLPLFPNDQGVAQQWEDIRQISLCLAGPIDGSH
jgi:hypothetical protein